ncbi:cadherin EGF LAG seven-pass G-type receptor 2-like [Mercenaria mercenaria]|uniref:cadherin EGF LAG seven-pass G-type receptor 2-like n=1 Tax=Mercenaria mercenaria TaxID=6596 RepID=UPI00234F810F|nr:cadherin EGF LAG seven-pass G-type receptor 2-like [Mercenaria mercenaria]
MAVIARTLTSLLLYLAAFYATDATITWSTPASGDGTASVAETAAVGDAVETLAATSDGTLGEFTLLTKGTPFTLAVGGALTVASATLDFETTPTYVLSIQGVDDTSTSTATLTVSVTDANHDPTFSSSTFSTCAADGSVAGTTVYTLSATDQDSGDTLTYSITGGNTGTDFVISSDKIVTANALNMATAASYDLIVQVSDATATASATVTVSVSASCNSAKAFVFSLLTILTALVVALN